MSLLLILSANQALSVCRPFLTTLLKAVWSCGRLRGSSSSLINVYNTYSAKTTCIIKVLRESAAIWGHLKSLIHVSYWETTTCRRSSRRLLGFHAFCITAAAVRERQMRRFVEFHYPKDQANCCLRLLGECFKSVHACRVNLGQTSGGFLAFYLGIVTGCCQYWPFGERCDGVARSEQYPKDTFLLHSGLHPGYFRNNAV